ncbi:MAG: hypothetical protein HKL79_07645 [Thermoplasmata archaeon]|nr:hypothetical protein [Thermoplasmata archaeon]
MALRRREIELSVEQPLGPPADGTVRLSVRFELGPQESTSEPEDLATALAELREELAELVGSPGAATHEDRDLAELVETYRPRQPELLELLRGEGDLSPREYELLKAHLAAAPPGAALADSRPAGPTVPAIPATPVGPATPRDVPDLLREYHIESLRQAGAVRARRQISFEEYMALKRHFEEAPTVPPEPRPRA